MLNENSENRRRARESQRLLRRSERENEDLRAQNEELQAKVLELEEKLAEVENKAQFSVCAVCVFSFFDRYLIWKIFLPGKRVSSATKN